MKQKMTLMVMLISISILISSFLATFSFAQTTMPCNQCGMTLDTTGQARYRIFDSNNNQYYACCPICAFRLIKTHGELNITSFCDYNGPTYPITINAKMNGSSLTVYPQTALVILGGSCSKNRLICNTAAADALLALPNNGTSRWLSPMSNATVLPNATRMGLAQAILQFAGGATSACAQCGMPVDVTGQARFKIFDANGTLHIACCPICAFRLLRTYGDLNITTFCDYYGPSFPITISAKSSSNDVTVTPSEALIILGGSCTKNRIVFNATAADALLASPNNGTSKWLSTLSNDTVAANATRISVAQAVAQYGGVVTPSPSPSNSPSPSPSMTPTLSPFPSPTRSPEPSETPSASSKPSLTPEVTFIPTESPETPSTKAEPTLLPEQSSNPSQMAAPTQTTTAVTFQCETCGMDVTSESQTRYRIIDGNGNLHYIECFMCALNLANDYDTLHIETWCDWYGPSYPIIIDTANYGRTSMVNPSTAIFLQGGSCVTARAALNQTAADALLVNGFSQYTSPEQQYALPSNTIASTVKDAIGRIAQNSLNKDAQGAQNTTVLIAAAIIGAVVIAGAFVAFKKLKHS